MEEELEGRGGERMIQGRRKGGSEDREERGEGEKQGEKPVGAAA